MTLPTALLDDLSKLTTDTQAALDGSYLTGHDAGKAEQSGLDQAQMQALSSANASLTTENTTLTTAVHTLTLANTSLTTQVTGLNQEVAALQAELDAENPPPAAPPLPLFGAAIQDNGDPSALEKVAGRSLGVHRTYYNLTQIPAAVAQVKADHAAGRVPDISFKLASTYVAGMWANAVKGQYDAQFKSLATALAGTGVPLVKLSIHHEPEGDDTLTDWTAMQDHVWPLLLGLAKNVEPWIILTAYDTFYSGNATETIAALYPKTAKPNLGFDAYNPYGDSKHPSKGWQEMSYYYDKIAPEAKSRGVKWGIAETGYTDSAAAKDVAWLDRAYDLMANHPVQPGDFLSYFDSTANSGTNTWPLNAAKQAVFVEVLKRSRPAGV